MPLLPQNAAPSAWDDEFAMRKTVIQSFNPFYSGAIGTAWTAGEVTAIKCLLPRASNVVTSLGASTSAAGVGLTANQNFLGLYRVDGNLCTQVGITPDLSTVWNSIQYFPVALAGGPVNLPGGQDRFCYVCLLTNTGTTSPSFHRANQDVTGIISNTGLTPGVDALPLGKVSAGATSLPASFLITGLTAPTFVLRPLVRGI